MIVSDPSPGHVRFVADNMRDKDAEEFLAVSFAEDRAALVRSLVDRYASGEDVFCFSDGGTPVAVGAMVHSRPNVITLMFFATDAFPRLALSIARFARQRLFPRYRAAGVHRIECVSIDGYEQAHRWIEILGLSFECRLPGFGRDGEAFLSFAWVADDVR